MNAIETVRLTKRFRRVRGYRDLATYAWQRSTDTAVEDVNLEVRRGELFGLLGENGAGKTTLIRMLSTTLLPTSGRASVGGHDVVRDPQAVRRIIGLVGSDERSFYWRLTGRQNLKYFAALYHVPAHQTSVRIAELLDRLGVTAYADRRFDSYSTGTRQKFAIARGMLTEPQVLFLDEPTRALDPIAADDLRRHVAGRIVGELGYTVLLATHTLTEAEAICHRIAIIRRGRLVEVGSMDDLRGRMGLSATLDLVVRGRPSALRETLCAVPGVEDVVVAERGGRARMSVKLRDVDGTTGKVIRAALDAGAEIDECTTRRPTLEDIYRAAHAEG